MLWPIHLGWFAAVLLSSLSAHAMLKARVGAVSRWRKQVWLASACLLLAGTAVHAQVTTSLIRLQNGNGDVVVDPVGNEIYVTGTTYLSASPNTAYVTAVNGSASPNDFFTSDYFEVPHTANQMAMNPATSSIYMLNSPANVVMVINSDVIAGDSAPLTIAVASDPVAVAVNTVTNMVYVLSKGGNSSSAIGTLTVIDGSTNTVLSTISIGADGVAAVLAINPATNMVFVAKGYYIQYGPETLGGQLMAYSGATGTTSATLVASSQLGMIGNSGVLSNSQPTTIAVNPASNMVYVADAVGYIYGINAAGLQPEGSNTDYIVIPDKYQELYQGNYVTASADPVALAINPESNTIYAANQNSTVMVIDGTGDTQPFTIAIPQPGGTSAPSLAGSIAVDVAMNKVYVTGSYSYYVTMIDPLNNNATTSIPVGVPTSTPGNYSNTAIAVNPVSHEVYVSTDLGLMIIDEPPGSPFTSSPIDLEGASDPEAVAVDPTLGQAYIVNEGTSNVAVVSGADALTFVDVSNNETMGNPVGVAVNPVTHSVLVVDQGDLETGAGGGLAIFNGANAEYADTNNQPLQASYIPTEGSNPVAVGVDPVLNLAYLANANDGTVTAVNLGNGNQVTSIPAGTTPWDVAINPGAQAAYVVDAGNDEDPQGGLTIINEAGNTATTQSDPQAVTPWAAAVSRYTNFVYVANKGSDNVSVFSPNGPGNPFLVSDIAVGATPVAVAVSSGNHKVYVANQGGNTVTVFNEDDSFDAPITINVGTAPNAVAVDDATGKIYVTNSGSNNVSVIDGATDMVVATISLPANASPSAIAADNVEGFLYIANSKTNNASLILDDYLQAAVPLNVTIAPLPQNATSNYEPTMSFNASSQFLPSSTPIANVFYQFDSTEGEWSQADGGGASFNESDYIAPGFHVLYAYATDGQEATATVAQPGTSPIVGKVTAYGFTVGVSPQTLMTPTTSITQAGGQPLPASATGGSMLNAVATTNASTYAAISATGACSVSSVAEMQGSNGGTQDTFTITFDNSGTSCGISASWLADSTYAAGSANATISVAGNQTGSFVGLPSSANYNSQFSATANTTGEQGAVVTASGPCTVSVGTDTQISGGGTSTPFTVTMTSGTGNCQLAANWPADTNFSGATASATVAAALATPATTLTAQVTSAYYNTTFQITATSTSSTAPTITATSGVCTVSSVVTTPNVNGTSTTATLTMNEGSSVCTVDASWPADSNYAQASATPLMVAALAAHPSVSFTGAPATAPYNPTGTSPFTVTATASDGATPTILGTSGVCSVSVQTSISNGATAMVTMNSGTGTCTLMANWPATADGNYTAASVQQTTVATKIAPTVTLTPSATSAAYNSTFTVSATTNASTLPTISGTSGICTAGTVTGAATSASATITMTTGTGTCTVSASWAADNNYNAATATSASVTATKIAPTVKFTGAPASAADGSTFTVTATTNASVVPTISGSGACSAGAVSGASASASATITMTASTGTCSMSATWATDNNYTTASASQSTTATNAALPIPTITWATPASITYGTALSRTQLDATAAYDGTAVAGTFTYTPASGTVLPAGSQTLSVLFTPTNAAKYATATASVTLQVNQATPKITWTKPASISYWTPLSATQLDASASFGGTSLPGAFNYTPNAGTVLGGGAQTLSVEFIPTDTVDFTTATDSVTIAVTDAAPVIDWTPLSPITYGTVLGSNQFDATATSAGQPVAGTFTYSPVAGTVEAGGSHTLSVTFTPTDTADFKTVTGKATVQVNPATPTIAWGTPAPVTVGTALAAAQLDAMATFNGAGVGGTYSYTPAKGTVVTAAGSLEMTVSFTPSNTTNYTSATGSVTLQVNPATPEITWAKPAAITFGTALSSTQLDATASVPGSLVYSPAIGTVLTAGAQTLSVTFTPTDFTDYATATDATTLTVNRAASTTAITSATPDPSTVGNPVTVSFSVSGSGVPAGTPLPTGSVTVTASTGESCSGTLSGGDGSCSIAFATTGLRTLKASYPGDVNYRASTSPAMTQKVN